MEHCLPPTTGVEVHASRNIHQAYIFLPLSRSQHCHVHDATGNEGPHGHSRACHQHHGSWKGGDHCPAQPAAGKEKEYAAQSRPDA
eukprot:805350-Pelagomonas_calceolata.AAC.8